MRSQWWRVQSVLLVRAEARRQLACLLHRQWLPALPAHCRLSSPGMGLAPCRLVVCMPDWLPVPRVGWCDAPRGGYSQRYFDEIKNLSTGNQSALSNQPMHWLGQIREQNLDQIWDILECHRGLHLRRCMQHFPVRKALCGFSVTWRFVQLPQTTKKGCMAIVSFVVSFSRG